MKYKYFIRIMKLCSKKNQYIKNQVCFISVIRLKYCSISTVRKWINLTFLLNFYNIQFFRTFYLYLPRNLIRISNLFQNIFSLVVYNSAFQFLIQIYGSVSAFRETLSFKFSLHFMHFLREFLFKIFCSLFSLEYENLVQH